MKKILLLSSLFLGTSSITFCTDADVRPSFEPRDLELVLKGGEARLLKTVRYFFSAYFPKIKPTAWVTGKPDLRYADLSGKTIKNMALIGALFEGANLKNTTFYNCTLDDANFSSADLSMATLENCSVNKAEFNQTTVEQLSLKKSSFIDTTFKNLQQATALSIEDCNFSGSSWTGTLLRGAQINNSIFKKACFDGKSQFLGGIIKQSNFENSNLLRAQCNHTLIDEQSKNTHAAFYDKSRLLPFALLTLKRTK